jgi:hypothetical protein
MRPESGQRYFQSVIRVFHTHEAAAIKARDIVTIARPLDEGLPRSELRQDFFGNNDQRTRQALW